jgi:hypothetical protein
MKKFIRDKATQAFLTKAGGWARNILLAEQFADARAADLARDAYRLRGCELYYLVGEAPSELHDFTIRIDDFPTAPPNRQTPIRRPPGP